MSARPFWVIFTLCIVVLIEWLIVPKMIDGVLSKEIVSMEIPISEVEVTLTEAGLQMPPALKVLRPEDTVKVAEVSNIVKSIGVSLPEQLANLNPETFVRVSDVEAAFKNAGIEMPAIIKARSPDSTITQEDMEYLKFSAKWALMYATEPARALLYVAGLSVMGILAGFLFASVAFRHLVKFGDRISEMSSTDKVAVLIGVIVGLLINALLLPNVLSYFSGPGPILGVVVFGIIMYLAIWAMMSMKDELKFYFPGAARAGELEREFQKPKILDTNVIIDGRVADICRAGFIEGKIFIPTFVLEELQHIADSSDSLRRARGRRGLDILNQMRKELDLVIRQSDPVNPENDEEVDVRLVKLAKEIDGVIVTNDFNLNKVAELQGVPVLNINELANALKPVVLPGEEMTVSIIKEGKEANQGVAYLDDGTMVVVEGARKHIGETVDVVVTSVLQTVAGKMIFTNLKALQDEEDEMIDRNVRSYSSVRPRKKTK